MAFCCSRKSQHSKSNIIKLEEKCKLHNNSFELISLRQTDFSQTIQACKQCQSSRGKEEFVSRKELNNRVQVQSVRMIGKQLIEKLNSLQKQTEESRGKLILLVDQICKSIKHEVQNLFVHSIIKQLPNELFTVSDVFELISNKTIEDFQGIFDHKLQLNQVDETSIGLLAKVSCKEQQAYEFLNILPKESEGIKGNLQKVCKDFEELLNILGRSVEQTKNLGLHNQVYTDPALNFMSPRDQDNTEKIKHINAQQPRQFVEQQKDENPQIKQIIEINVSLIAYWSGTKIYIIETQNFKQVKCLDCEGDVTAICSFNSILVSSVEESEDLFQLIFWDWQKFDKLRVINAHQKYIWKIINLPMNWIATCSDDQTIKIYDDKSIQEKIKIEVHQASVNDIALINHDIMISVSDDSTVAASNYQTGEIKDIYGENCEIKCVVALDGINFVTGNSNGEIRIYNFIDKIQIQCQLKFHEQVVRFISRIDSKTFVTSSWDGTNVFARATGEILNQILEGPRKNFSEPLLWSNNSLWASIGGQLHIY